MVVSPSDFELIAGREALATYQFNTGIAKHNFCRTCGIYPFYVPRSDPDKIDVNARCLDGVDPGQIRTRLFDGKNWEVAIEGHLPWRDDR